MVVGQCQLNGVSNAALLFDPASNRWSAAQSPPHPRIEHSATRLQDGRLLIAGGVASDSPAESNPIPLHSTEIFDPRSGAWTPGTALLTGRAQHTATLLWDGTVFIAGGQINCRHQPPIPTDRSEVVASDGLATEPATSLVEARLGHTATEFAGGILLAGGLGASGPAASEVVQARCQPPYALETPPLLGHVAARLPDGVLLLGADVAGRLSDLAWAPLALPAQPRFTAIVVMLRRSVVLLVGGSPYSEVHETGLYDPALDSWTAGPSIGGYYVRGAGVELSDGRVLLVGLGAEISTGAL